MTEKDEDMRSEARGNSEEKSPDDVKAEPVNSDDASNKDEEQEDTGMSSSAAVDLTQVASTDERLMVAEQKAEEYYDKYLRACAELDNFRKRSIKERADILRYSGEGIARDILEVVDTLELALARGAGDASMVIEGVKLVLDRFVAILDSHSISSKTTKGSQFNPEYQEALATVPSSDYAPGIVIEEFKRPYFYKDKLLRPGQAVVATEVTAVVDENQAVTDKADPQ